MPAYFLRRLLLIPLTLGLMVLLAFAIGALQGRDAAEEELRMQLQSTGQSANPRVMERLHRELRRKQGLDLPLFYLSVGTLAQPDSLAKLLPAKRDSFEKLLWRYGNAPQVFLYLDSAISRDQLEATATPWKTYVPALHWHGKENRFHRFVSRSLRLDFSYSSSEKRPVGAVIREALPWTLLFNFLAMGCTFLMSLPLGVWMARGSGAWQKRLAGAFLYFLYALPQFWVGTLLILYLAGGDHFQLFPESGVMEVGEEAPFGERAADVLWHLALPVFCAVYPALAYVSRQARNALRGEFHHDYIRTARAKGLPESRILWRHALRNAWIPVIGMFASVFSGLLSGQVILESLYTLPGLGQKSFAAARFGDEPLVVGILLLVGMMTVLAYLLADLLYLWADPRIRHK